MTTKLEEIIAMLDTFSREELMIIQKYITEKLERLEMSRNTDRMSKNDEKKHKADLLG